MYDYRLTSLKTQKVVVWKSEMVKNGREWGIDIALREYKGMQEF